MKKHCSGCKQTKDASEFHKNRCTRDGLAYCCKACRKSNPKEKQGSVRRSIAARKRNPARHNANARKYRLGVSREDYEALLKAQDGKCGICHEPESDRHQSGQLKTLAVDHDHETGAIRGLLCSRCNRALGGFGDDPALLQAAIGYLQSHATNPTKIVPFKPAKQIESYVASEANWSAVP